MLCIISVGNTGKSSAGHSGALDNHHHIINNLSTTIMRLEEGSDDVIWMHIAVSCCSFNVYLLFIFHFQLKYTLTVCFNVIKSLWFSFPLYIFPPVLQDISFPNDHTLSVAVSICSLNISLLSAENGMFTTTSVAKRLFFKFNG